jgi:hypothetical protein
MGPMVASSSAFISTTGLRWSKASSVTRQPNSTDPVTSMITSMSGQRVMKKASSATHGLPAATASSSFACVSAVTTSGSPA